MKDTSKAYDDFLNIFLTCDNKSFSKVEIELKIKFTLCPGTTKAIPKSFKRKQRLFEKLLKNRILKSETHYKEYKNLFETVKPTS